MNLKGRRGNIEVDESVFSNRVTEHWDKLPPGVDRTNTTSAFIRKLNKYINDIIYRPENHGLL